MRYQKTNYQSPDITETKENLDRIKPCLVETILEDKGYKDKTSNTAIGKYKILKFNERGDLIKTLIENGYSEKVADDTVNHAIKEQASGIYNSLEHLQSCEEVKNSLESNYSKKEIKNKVDDLIYDISEVLKLRKEKHGKLEQKMMESRNPKSAINFLSKHCPIMYYANKDDISEKSREYCQEELKKTVNILLKFSTDYGMELGKFLYFTADIKENKSESPENLEEMANEILFASCPIKKNLDEVAKVERYKTFGLEESTLNNQKTDEKLENIKKNVSRESIPQYDFTCDYTVPTFIDIINTGKKVNADLSILDNYPQYGDITIDKLKEAQIIYKNFMKEYKGNSPKEDSQLSWVEENFEV